MKVDKQGLSENILVGLGNPLLDISAVVDKDFLDRYHMKENDATLFDPEKHGNLYGDLTTKYKAEYIAGGSVQNALRVAQWILEKPKVTTFFGCVGVDDYSKILHERATSDGVNAVYQYNDREPTGTCAVLITKFHRSLCAHLGSANCFTIDHISKPDNRKLLEGARFYYISGFFLTVNPPSIQEVAKLALAHDKPFIMNLSAPFISQLYKEPLMQVMPYVDVIFGNETEAEAFATEQSFATKDVREIALKIAALPKLNKKRGRIVIITQGIDPVVVAHDGEISEYPVEALPSEKLVDTNGAGDAFTGGFLSQYIQGRELDVCVKCAIWAAREIVQRSGCTFDGKAAFDPSK
ncbi:adenosine kinase [Cylas formicarius]|uniref:adenosine kinase n=1 Tax=Cylas formicarius TaxID=197179 RepID=UPI0029589370|nr:adenosine kinase [Cylas formicarius]